LIADESGLPAEALKQVGCQPNPFAGNTVAASGAFPANLAIAAPVAWPNHLQSRPELPRPASHEIQEKSPAMRGFFVDAAARQRLSIAA
jgi:hypothetical protein